MTLSIARGLMRLTLWIAPSSRADWKTAMQAEFTVIESGAEALSWAAGCLGAALGWRAVSEAPFIAGLTLACAIPTFVFLALFRVSDYSPENFLPLAGLQQQGCIALACLACGLAWPSRAPLSALVVPLSFGGWQFLKFQFAYVLTPSEGFGAVSAWSAIFIAMGQEIWPGVLAALVGGWIGASWRRRAMIRV